MTKEEAAAKLDGNEYLCEGSKGLFAEMKTAGLVAVFGASDDLMEFRGAIDDEVGAFDGGEALVTPGGLLSNECENERCPYHAANERAATKIAAIWDDGGFSWRYETVIPHVQFIIREDGEPYCRGIVFAMGDVPTHPSSEGRAHG